MVSYSIQVLKAKIPLENTYSWSLKMQMNNKEIKPVRQQMRVQEEISVKKKLKFHSILLLPASDVMILT